MSALLALRDINVAFDGERILNGVSLTVRDGEFIALVGPNGAGKSTLLKAAAGLIPVEAGARHMADRDLETQTARERARAVSYLPQARPVFWSIPVRNIVALGRFAYGGAGARLSAADAQAVDKAMIAAGVAHLKERAAANLSGGELARAHLARALAAEAPLLLADEPTAALDPEHQIAVMDNLRAITRKGRAAIAAIHDLSLAAAYCTRIVAIKDGAVVADGPPHKIVNPDLLAQVFNVNGDITWAEDKPALSLRARSVIE